MTVSEFVIFEFPSMFQEGLFLNMSVTTLSLIINEYGEGKSHIPLVLRHSGVFPIFGTKHISNHIQPDSQQ